jgi:hypothetical protein
MPLSALHIGQPDGKRVKYMKQRSKGYDNDNTQEKIAS